MLWAFLGSNPQAVWPNTFVDKDRLLPVSSHYKALRDTPDLKNFSPSREHNKPLSKQMVVYCDESM